MQHFRLSFVVTLLLLALAGIWGYNTGGAAGSLQAVLVAGILGIMEVSLSFDNAVVNAAVLRNWDAFWQKMFLTAGVLVAVFGMRLLFPLLIVSIATGLGLVDVWSMALNQPQEYARHLTDKHAEVAAFGGIFLLMVFLRFLFDEEKELHWLGWIEQKLGEHGSESLAVLVSLVTILVVVQFLPAGRELAVLTSGVMGLAVYVGVDYLSGLLEEKEETETVGKLIQRGSVGGFLYLEVLDASFSFDGVIGAFAITSDVVIIMIGLGIGAMFVRSLTVLLVRNGTLEEFVYLEHGAHYAIGILAVIMMVSMTHHIPEWFTGLSGVAFIGLSLWSSILYKRKELHTGAGKVGQGAE